MKGLRCVFVTRTPSKFPTRDDLLRNRRVLQTNNWFSSRCNFFSSWVSNRDYPPPIPPPTAPSLKIRASLPFGLYTVHVLAQPAARQNSRENSLVINNGSYSACGRGEGPGKMMRRTREGWHFAHHRATEMGRPFSGSVEYWSGCYGCIHVRYIGTGEWEFSRYRLVTDLSLSVRSLPLFNPPRRGSCALKSSAATLGGFLWAECLASWLSTLVCVFISFPRQGVTMILNIFQ